MEWKHKRINSNRAPEQQGCSSGNEFHVSVPFLCCQILWAESLTPGKPRSRSRRRCLVLQGDMEFYLLDLFVALRNAAVCARGLGAYARAAPGVPGATQSPALQLAERS